MTFVPCLARALALRRGADAYRIAYALATSALLQHKQTWASALQPVLLLSIVNKKSGTIRNL